jgi:hypothetical protein
MAVLDRVPVDEITAQARQVHLGRALLTVFAAFFFAVGWLAGALFMSLAWSATAVKVGWLEARRRNVASG